MEHLLQALAWTAYGAFVVDESHRIIHWNAAAEALTGLAEADVRGKSCYEVLGGTDEQGRFICWTQCWVAVAGLRGRPIDSFDTEIRTRSGRVRSVNMSSFAYALGEQDASVWVHLFQATT